MQQMEAAGFEARVALQRKADEEVLSILHFQRRPGAGLQQGQQGQRQPADGAPATGPLD